jgi:hypothetical protein
VDPETERALEAIDRICATPIPIGPVELDADYLRDIERIEQAPENQAGADKIWIEVSNEQWLADYRAARRK